ncbi:hypothetical protein [Algicola sagamiensis]|uniref:hypothetical protein n=1 Tax=Algicola sagamiensis TaxID=163869 RepID=UPI00036712D9|nr:hypothetical protein [Algicola sagamiensis]
MERVAKFSLHAVSLLLVASLLSWIAISYDHSYVTTTCCALAYIYLLITHWRKRSTRFITVIFSIGMVLNQSITWGITQIQASLTTYLVVGSIFDCIMWWVMTNYDKVANFVGYQLPKGALFFQVLTIGKLYILSIVINLLFLCSLPLYYGDMLKQPAIFFDSYFEEIKIFISILIYLNVWSILFDADSLEILKRRKSQANSG